MAFQYKAAFDAASGAIGFANSIGIPTELILGGLFEDETAAQLEAIEQKIDLVQASLEDGFDNITNATFKLAMTEAITPTFLAYGALQNPSVPAADRDDALDNAKEGLAGTSAIINTILREPLDTVSRSVLQLTFEALTMSLGVMTSAAEAFNNGSKTEAGDYNHGGIFRFKTEIENGIATLRLIETKIREKYDLTATFIGDVFIDEDANTFFDEAPAILLAGTYHSRAQINITTNFSEVAGDDFRIKTYLEELFGPGAQIVEGGSGTNFNVFFAEQFNRFTRSLETPSLNNPTGVVDTPLDSRDLDDAAVVAEIQTKINEINQRAEDFFYNALTDFKVSAAFPPDLSFYGTDAEGIESLAAEFEAAIAGVVEVNTTLVEGKVTVGSAFDDFLTGSSLGDVLRGLAGDDYLRGAGGDDVIEGGEGSDYYFGGKGSDTLQDDGTGGVDVAVFEGNRTDGSFKISAGLVVVSRPNSDSGGVDENTLSGIEVLKFDDVTAKIEDVLALEDLVIEGTEQADTLLGRANADTLFGFGGNDELISAGGADRMEGGTGSDVYHVNNVDDEVVEAENAGNDTVRSSINRYTLGANVENLILVLQEPDRFGVTPDQFGHGNDLNNIIEGADGISFASTTLRGFGGNDILRAGDTNTGMVGGAGDDLLEGGAGTGDRAIYTDATSGVDIDLRLSVQRKTGGLGIDTFVSIEGLEGSQHNDRLVGDAGSNSISGGAGNDILRDLGDVGDFLDGGAGNDKITAGNGDDFIFGGEGDDIIKGLDGHDFIEDNDFGDGGNDRIFGGKGADFIRGGVGDDFLRGNNGNDNLDGGTGEDDLRGGNNNDTLRGGADDDWLLGGGGFDIINGGAGDDILRGAQGDGRFDGKQDTFVYRAGVLGEGGFDRIRDFEDGIDLIDLSSYGFTDFDTQVAALANDKIKGLRIDFADGDVLFIHDFLKEDFDVSDVILV